VTVVCRGANKINKRAIATLCNWATLCFRYTQSVLFYTLVLCAALLIDSTSAFAQQRVSIQRVSLADALVQFVSQTGVGVVVEDDVDTSIIVSAVDTTQGNNTALEMMLAGLALKADKNVAGFYVIRRFQLDTQPPPTISSPRLEEQVVTGTSIKGGLARSLYPMSVFDRSDLQTHGSPTMIDLIANVPSISGTENQSNQFHNVNAAGTANINLRGLGVSRTLVLLNGKRLPVSALPHNDGQAFVDINTIPSIALEQVDILKDGASATYGSDAVAGVVNFITRRQFEGLEFRASGKYIEESEGDWDVGVLAGGRWGVGRWLGSLSYSRRNELKNESREEIIEPRVDIPQLQRIVYGVSSLGNPGSFIPIDAATAAGGLSNAEVAARAAGRDNYVRDPQCAAVGSHPFEDQRCGFNYVIFDNLVEQEERWQVFSSWQAPLSNTVLGNAATFYSDINFSYLEVQEWKTSPSYPPVKEADVVQYLPADHPGLVDFIANNPGITESDGDVADFSGGAVFVGRPVGVAGPVESGFRSHQTFRWLTGISGDVGLQYDISFAYARSHAESRTEDTLIERWQAALQGLGGPNCTGQIAGENGCEFFNPFASSIPFSSNYDPALANADPLLSWMREDLVQENTSQLMVADAVFSGSLDYRAGRTVDFAFGLQHRQERLKIRFNDLGDVATNPGSISVPGELPGVFIFFRGGLEDDVSQNVTALFGELAVPVREDFLLQLALRYENYGDNIGQSLDPKIALRWDLSTALTLRASAGTSFRAPSLNQTGLDTTSLELIGAAFAFKAVDRIGNPNLEPEQAVSSSMGLDWTVDEHWHLNVDYWRFNLHNVIVQESANAIVNAVLADANSPRSSQVVFDGSGNISRILSHYINGPDILVDGFDLGGDYTTYIMDGSWVFGWEVVYLQRYDISASDLLPEFSADGRLNAGTFVKSLPKWQGNIYFNFSKGLVNSRLVLNVIGSYTDDGLGILKQTPLDAFVTEKRVDAFYTVDAHFALSLPGDDAAVTLSLLNIADTDPPAVRQDMRFDTTLHNAFGRMIKINVSYKI
jgi:iron complex outermembrane recepter protein